jgi:hypothetical protein
MKKSSRPPAIATTEQVADLGQKADLRDITLSSGHVVPKETLRALFKDAAAASKRKLDRHAAIAR